jgi:hypothetical protein
VSVIATKNCLDCRHCRSYDGPACYHPDVAYTGVPVSTIEARSGYGACRVPAFLFEPRLPAKLFWWFR